MSSPTRIHIAADKKGFWAAKQSSEATAKISELLQQDLEKHDVFFNEKHFHNHTTHHLLTLYDTGASASDLQRTYDDHASYMLARREQGGHVVEALKKDYDGALGRYLGRGEYYGDFLRFYQAEMERLGGWREVVGRYLVGNEVLSRRLFAGLLHPFIQLMYGLEWDEPAIVAQGLAQASVHPDDCGELFAAVDDKMARKASGGGGGRYVVDLLEGLAADAPDLLAASRFDDGGDHRHIGRWSDLVDREPGLVADYLAANVGIDGEMGEEAFGEMVDEMVHAMAYMAVASIFHAPHKPKFDFYLIHHLNLTPAFLHLKHQTSFPLAARARLLDWKRRADLVVYLTCGSPRLDLAALRAYVPRDRLVAAAADESWTPVERPEDLLPRFHAVRDDGHAVKVARALLLARRATGRYAAGGGRQAPRWVRLGDDEAWRLALYALLDSVEGAAGMADRWVLSAGFDNAWEGMPREGM